MSNLDYFLLCLVSIVAFWVLGCVGATIYFTSKCRLRPNLSDIFLLTIGGMFRVIGMLKIDEKITRKIIDKLVKERIARTINELPFEEEKPLP